jgi:hypothetical protein
MCLAESTLYDQLGDILWGQKVRDYYQPLKKKKKNEVLYLLFSNFK